MYYVAYYTEACCLPISSVLYVIVCFYFDLFVKDNPFFPLRTSVVCIIRHLKNQLFLSDSNSFHGVNEMLWLVHKGTGKKYLLMLKFP